MLLKITQTNLTYPTTNGTAESPSVEPNGANVTFTISNLFGNAQSTAQSLVLSISYDDYLTNFDDADLLVLVKQKVLDKFNNGDVAVRVEGINNTYDANSVINAKKVRFNTLDIVNKSNTLYIKDSVDLDIETYNAAKVTKMDGIINAVKQRLISEFTA